MAHTPDEIDAFLDRVKGESTAMTDDCDVYYDQPDILQEHLTKIMGTLGSQVWNSIAFLKFIEESPGPSQFEAARLNAMKQQVSYFYWRYCCNVDSRWWSVSAIILFRSFFLFDMSPCVVFLKRLV